MSSRDEWALRSQELNRRLGVFSSELRGLCGSVHADVAALKRAVNGRPCGDASYFRQCLADVSSQVSSVEGQLRSLEAVTTDTLSFEELVGHALQLHQANMQRTQLLVKHLQQYGYVDGFAGSTGEGMAAQPAVPGATQVPRCPAAPPTAVELGRWGKENDGAAVPGERVDVQLSSTPGCSTALPPLPPMSILPLAAALPPGSCDHHRRLLQGTGPPLSAAQQQQQQQSAFHTPSAPGLAGVVAPTPRSVASSGLSALSYSPGMRELLGKYGSGDESISGLSNFQGRASQASSVDCGSTGGFLVEAYKSATPGNQPAKGQEQRGDRAAGQPGSGRPINSSDGSSSSSGSLAQRQWLQQRPSLPGPATQPLPGLLQRKGPSPGAFQQPPPSGSTGSRQDCAGNASAAGRPARAAAATMAAQQEPGSGLGLPSSAAPPNLGQPGSGPAPSAASHSSLVSELAAEARIGARQSQCFAAASSGSMHSMAEPTPVSQPLEPVHLGVAGPGGGPDSDCEGDDGDSTMQLYQQIIRRRSSPKPQRVLVSAPGHPASSSAAVLATPLPQPSLAAAAAGSSNSGDGPSTDELVAKAMSRTATDSVLRSAAKITGGGGMRPPRFTSASAVALPQAGPGSDSRRSLATAAPSAAAPAVATAMGSMTVAPPPVYQPPPSSQQPTAEEPAAMLIGQEQPSPAAPAAVESHAGPPQPLPQQEDQRLDGGPRVVCEVEYGALPPFSRSQFGVEELNAALRQLHGVAATSNSGALSLADVEAQGFGPRSKALLNCLLKLGRARLEVRLGAPPAYVLQ